MTAPNADAVRRGVEAVERTMKRCNMRLAQIDDDVETYVFGPIDLVDVERLVTDIIEAAQNDGSGASGAVGENPT
jgi:hypothetical protein